jgi:hypothetical protein
MHIERLICDVCGIENSVARYRVPDGSEPDPSGNGHLDNVIDIDLCNRCAGRMMDAGKVRKELRNQR